MKRRYVFILSYAAKYLTWKWHLCRTVPTPPLLGLRNGCTVPMYKAACQVCFPIQIFFMHCFPCCNELDNWRHVTKGEIKPKAGLARRRFSQKTNERIWFVCCEKQKSKQICSLFGRIYGARICFWFYLTFSQCISVEWCAFSATAAVDNVHHFLILVIFLS